MLRVGQKLGKYRIERRLADGPFAVVYGALDTIEGVRVALKIPHARLLDPEVLEDFRREVRLMAKLDHASILPLKDASFIEGHFVLAVPLGERTLGDRMQRRMSVGMMLDYADQMLEAVAYAHHRRVIHCDVKPENFILFGDNRLCLADFGISKVARRTVQGSGSGTVGYVAPEQAMGKPSFRSDVFSLGLVFYRMFSGRLPEWPYQWPPPGFDRVRKRLHPDLIEVVRRAVEADPRKRFRDAGQMQVAFRKVKRRAIKPRGEKGRRTTGGKVRSDWQTARRKQFQREHGKLLETRFACHRCAGPVAEAMQACPWCGAARKVHREETPFPAQCPRCRRGIKLDWGYCPWCYGAGFELTTTQQYTDVRYQARCANSQCRRKLLMPFMRYCPWCHHKVRRPWKLAGTKETCHSCGWGVLAGYWKHCPWCGKGLRSR
ncbi:MAG: serine/threonine-protein kinase [Planctomycetota bacterium]